MFKFIFKFLCFSLLLFSSASISEEKCLSMHVVINTAAGYITPAGNIGGFHYDFLTALEQRTGLCMNKKLLPYSRAQKGVELGGHDGGILARSKNLDAKVVYLVKLLTSKTIILPRKGVIIKHYQDLNNLIIGKVRGAVLNHFLDNPSTFFMVQLSNYEHGFRMLNKGRIDAIVGNELGLITSARLESIDKIDWPGKLIINQREVWLVLSNKSKYLGKSKQLRQAAQDLINEGVLEDILKKHFGVDWLLIH
jgi:ABC-type amino acid transport substrate-binding protein